MKRIADDFAAIRNSPLSRVTDAAPAPADPALIIVAEIDRACAQIDLTHDAFDQGGTPSQEAAWRDSVRDLVRAVERLSSTPATTLSGVLAKLRFSDDSINGGENLLASAIADVERLCGGTP